ncbi:hypothetical protein [Acinetobacter sp. SA01]|jgi:hypothetical protein|uniref:hypothetical protein n=1 Tax=Acinetobacter sp. SA01 TaxID=1862567 RepID=UPI00140785A9|nr:hypothetical protein [Acinetobacter sp. SA01]
MNLIEQLGGYEKARKHYDDMREAINQVYYSHSSEYESQQLKKALLEYRRQHNIYEAGDLVVMTDIDDYDTIFKVIGKPMRLYHLQGNDDLFYGRLDFQIRHATDAEIEACKRLEVD